MDDAGGTLVAAGHGVLAIAADRLLGAVDAASAQCTLDVGKEPVHCAHENPLCIHLKSVSSTFTRSRRRSMTRACPCSRHLAARWPWTAARAACVRASAPALGRRSPSR